MAALANVVRVSLPPRARRWLAGGFISVYLTALGIGLFCHTFGWKSGAHPLMYFVVWDMFCGWSAHDTRFQVIAEGVSGRHYKVLPGPWGDLHPHGNLSRHHYDVDGVFCGRMAMNVLRHTEHEDVTRIFVVEEAWPKKFNMPDSQWAARFDEPKDPKTYYRLRHVITPEGVLLGTDSNWLDYQSAVGVLSNPRLAADAQRSRPFLALEPPRDLLPGSAVSERNALPRSEGPWGN